MRKLILLSILLGGCAARAPQVPATTTLSPGCSLDGGRHWFLTRADGLCYPGDAQRIGASVPCGTALVWTDRAGRRSTWLFPCWPEHRARAQVAAPLPRWQMERQVERAMGVTWAVGEWVCPAGWHVEPPGQGRRHQEYLQDLTPNRPGWSVPDGTTCEDEGEGEEE